MTASAAPGLQGLQGLTGPAGEDATAAVDVHQVAHGFSVGNAIKHAGGIYQKAQANSAANAEVVGIVTAVAGADDFTFVTGGVISTLSGLVADTVYYLDPTTAGALTATEPTTPGQISKPILISLTTTSGVFANFRGIEVGASSVTRALMDYKEYTGTAISVTGTTDANAVAIVTGNAVEYDGVTPVDIEFNVPYAAPPASADIVFNLYDGSTDLGRIGYVSPGSASHSVSITNKRRLTPSAGSHTYSIRVWRSIGIAGTVGAGVGGTGAWMPISLRITRADPVNTVNVQAAVGGWTAVQSDEIWTYNSADDPTYTFSVPGDKTTVYSPGMRIRISQSTGGTKYFIVTAVTYAAPTTTVTLYGGTDYDLNNEAISNRYYSTHKAPVGFPLSPTKWTVQLKDTSARQQTTPATNTWYNPGSLSLSIPIGSWDVIFEGCMFWSDATSLSWNVESTLSTANNSESDNDFTSTCYSGPAKDLITPFYRRKTIDLAVKTIYYANLRTQSTGLDNMWFYNGWSPLIIRAVCAYL